ncbi:MAG TPA: DUF3108 domain-containing protein [Gemmatimonadaceae bacterium]|nr:DUF3108 domain-containing protein [Gemmatimonadaceae bacterium]
MIAAVALAILTGIESAIAPPALDHPFGVGEKLVYDVRFGPVKVGTSIMEVREISYIRGRAAYKTYFRVQGGTFFYKVDDVLQSWIDTETLSSLRFVQTLQEGSRDRERHFEIYPDRSVYVEVTKSPQELPSVSRPLDDASFLYFIRTIPLEIGQTYEFNRYFKPDRNPVRVRVMRRERIVVPAGTFNAIVVRPTIKTKGIFAEEGEAEVWLSDDNRRMVLQLKSKVSFGSLNLFLRSFTPPR